MSRPTKLRLLLLCLGLGSLAGALIPESVLASSGAGNSLTFNGSNFVQVPDHPGLKGMSDMTFQAWVWKDQAGGTEVIVSRQNGYTLTMDGSAFTFKVNEASSLTSEKLSRAGTWVHITAVFQGSAPEAERMRLYINGQPAGVASTKESSIYPDFTRLYLGGSAGAGSLKGKLDEVRIWNKALTLGEIRESMCHKYTSGQKGLVAYYTFDNTNGTNIPNGSESSDLDGQAVGGILSGVSSAPIGDASTYAYNGQTLQLGHPDGDKITLAGLPPGTGIHLYRIDGPAVKTGMPKAYMRVSGARYYGVFAAGLNEPSEIKISFRYAGTPGWNLVQENTLGLVMRHAATDNVWMDLAARQRMDVKTFEQVINITPDEPMAELVTGFKGAVLPVRLGAFQIAQAQDGKINLKWSTLTEDNNSHFVVERSRDGRNFTPLVQLAGAGNSLKPVQYSAADAPGEGVWYYRLKQVDFNGKTSYSETRNIQIAKLTNPKQELLISGANPFDAQLRYILKSDEAEDITIELSDMQGRIHRSETFTQYSGRTEFEMEVESLASGLYLLRMRSGHGQQTLRAVKN